MNRYPGFRRMAWIGAALIVLVNAFMLAGAAWNRSAEDSRMELSQRELRIPYSWGLEREKSALALQLSWRVAASSQPDQDFPFHYQRQADWLDPPRLRELGFDLPDPPPVDEHARRRIDRTRHAWLVLELEGDAHAAVLARAWAALQELEARAPENPVDDTLTQDRIQSARKRWQDERDRHSRLFVIDAGADPDALRQQYPDRHRYLIVGGLIGVSVTLLPDEHDRLAKPAYAASIRQLDIESIHVPARFHASIGHGTSDNPAYRATVAWGRRHEPWVVAVDADDE